MWKGTRVQCRLTRSSPQRGHTAPSSACERPAQARGGPGWAEGALSCRACHRSREVSFWPLPQDLLSKSQLKEELSDPLPRLPLGEAECNHLQVLLPAWAGLMLTAKSFAAKSSEVWLRDWPLPQALCFFLIFLSHSCSGSLGHPFHGSCVPTPHSDLFQEALPCI